MLETRLKTFTGNWNYKLFWLPNAETPSPHRQNQLLKYFNHGCDDSSRPWYGYIWTIVIYIIALFIHRVTVNVPSDSADKRIGYGAVMCVPTFRRRQHMRVSRPLIHLYIMCLTKVKLILFIFIALNVIFVKILLIQFWTSDDIID